MKRPQQWSAIPQISLMVCAILGAALGFLILYLDTLVLRWQIALVLGVMAGSFGLIIFSYNYDKLFRILLALFALSIPLNLNVVLFYRLHAGTSGIHISLSIALCFILFLLMLYKRFLIGKIYFEFNKTLILPAVIYVVAGILSLLNADRPDLVGLEVLRILTLLGIMLVMMNLKSDKEIRFFVMFLLIGIQAQGIIALTQYLTEKPLGLTRFGEEQLISQDIGHMVSRAGGTIGHPNILAYYLEILIPLVFALMLVESRKKMLLFLTGTLGVGLTALVVTLSRAGWITIPISFSIVFAVIFKGRFFRSSTFLVLLLTGFFSLGILYFAFPLIEKRLTHDDYESAASRIPLNEATLSVIKRFPLVGAGLNNFAEIFHKYDLTRKSRILQEKHVVHNLFLWVWAEIGTFGLLVFFWMFGSVFFVIKMLQSKVDLWYRALSTGIAAGLFAHLIHGLFDPGFRISLQISVLVYTLIGLVGAISLGYRKQKEFDKNT